MKIRGFLIVLVALTLGGSSAAHAQSAPWTRAMGMAGADFALARGYAAIEWNPANIFVEDSVAFSFGSSLHGGRVVVQGAGLGQLANIVTAAGSGSSSLLDGIPAGGLRIDAVSEGITARTLANALNVPDPSADADVPTMAFTYKNGGLSIRQQTIGTAIVSRELVDLAVNGFKPEQISEYAARNTQVRSFTLTSATLGVGKRLSPRLSGGLGIRYVYGRKLMTGRVFEPEIDVDNETLSAAAAAVESRGANGIGLDVAMTYRLRPNLFLSAAVQNLFQRLSWSEELWVSQSAFDQEDIGSSDMRELIDRFRAEEMDPQGTTLEAYAAARDLFVESFLPRTVRVGVGYRASTGTEIQLTASRNFGPGTLVPPSPEAVVLGMEHRFGWAKTRGGFAFERGGTRHIAAGFGVDIDSLQFDLAGGWTSGNGPHGGGAHGLSGSIGFGFLILGDRIAR